MTTTAHPYDESLRHPDGTGSVETDWRDAGEDGDRWSSMQTVEYGDHTLVASSMGDPVGAIVAGDYVTERDIRERADDEDIHPDDDYDADEDTPPGPWRVLADALDDAERSGCGGAAEGPMMNYFYPLETGSYQPPVDLAQWAARLDGLPLCAVELDGDHGLALTGGGMDLSWEIAEAHLRLGYRVPTWITLPAMATGGRLGRDHGGTAPLSDDDAAIVRAVIRVHRDAAERATWEADRLATRYGMG